MAETDDQLCGPEKAGLQRGPDITMDSGAAVSVTDPAVYPGCPIEPSPGSKAGQRFISAFGQTTPNMGQLTPQMFLESGDIGSLKYQAAKVKKPLAAVTDFNKRGNPVWFDGHASHVIPAACPQLAQIRQLIKDAQKKIPLHWENGVYRMRTWVKPTNPRPFVGQGR